MSTVTLTPGQVAAGYLRAENYEITGRADIDIIAASDVLLARKKESVAAVLVFETARVPDSTYPDFAVTDYDRCRIGEAAEDARLLEVITVTYEVTNDVTGTTSPVIRHWPSLALCGVAVPSGT